MEINIKESEKIVEIWIPSDKDKDELTNQYIKKICSEYKKKKYLIAVYRSGKGDLEKNTTDLLLRNKNN